LGDEARSKGAQVLLGPTINIQRTPIGGRGFECYSEDPLLTGQLAAAFTAGVQSKRVAACLKHFVCNDTEYKRHVVSSEVDERTLREIYLRPFEIAVKQSGAWSVMSAYNRINGVFASSHRELLVDILKQQWGFDGVVISDWGASLHTVENANGGLDLEMPGPTRTMGDKLLEAVRTNQVSETELDDKVRRLLRLLVRTGRLDAPDEIEERTEDTPANRALARRAAIEGSVLLKNEAPDVASTPLLPLDITSLGRIAVIGPNAKTGRIQGGGSSAATPQHQVHPLAAIESRLEGHMEVVFETGCLIDKYLPAFDPRLLVASRAPGQPDRPGLAIEYFDSPDFSGMPVRSRVSKRSKMSWFGAFGADFLETSRFSARFSGTYTAETSGRHTFGLMSAGKSRMRFDGKLLIDNWNAQTPGESFYSNGSTEQRADLDLEAGDEYPIEFDFQRPAGQQMAGIQFGVLPPTSADPIADAVRAAATADAVVLVVGTNDDWETEGNDRESMALPGAQSELIERVARANPNTVVVVNAGSPVDTGWLDSVPAALQVWFPGQEFGDALCDVLFGDANPSGKLPITIPKALDDTPAHAYYPGRDNELRYEEGVFVGYRGYGRGSVPGNADRQVEPRLPFGHGLSYTTFGYGELTVDSDTPIGTNLAVELDITNTGQRAGAEVVQLYLHESNSRVPRPALELAAFAKVRLEPGETRRVVLSVPERAFAWWDMQQHGWNTQPGEFELLAGSSSRDIRSRLLVQLRAQSRETE
ncbi:MAG: glycoside hydrolase family 3 C-terminal domain-containing protein, partial [Myxococcota bacterium]